MRMRVESVRLKVSAYARLRCALIRKACQRKADLLSAGAFIDTTGESRLKKKKQTNILSSRGTRQRRRGGARGSGVRQAAVPVCARLI